jgi:hypothetical protein
LSTSIPPTRSRRFAGRSEDRRGLFRSASTGPAVRLKGAVGLCTWNGETVSPSTYLDELTRRFPDICVAAVHGIVGFPKHTRTMDWTDTLAMAELAINALLHFWRQTKPAHAEQSEIADLAVLLR